MHANSRWANLVAENWKKFKDIISLMLSLAHVGVDV